MSLASRLTALVQAIGADVKKLYQIAPYAAVDTTALGNINVASAPAATAFDAPSTDWLTGRILLYAQDTVTENGIWLYNGAGQPMTRASDALKSKNGQKVYVRKGAVFGNTTFVSRSDINAVGTEQWYFAPETIGAFAPVTAVGDSSINVASPPAASGWGPYSPVVGDRVLITSGPTPGIWIYRGAGIDMLRVREDLQGANPRGKLVPVLDNSSNAYTGLYAVYAPGAFFSKVFDAFARDLHTASNLASQTGFAAETMLDGSVITVPLGRIKPGTKYRCKFNIQKTAAGVANLQVNVKMGTLGTVADATRTTHIFGPQTAVVDNGQVEIESVFRGASPFTNMIMQTLATLSHMLATTGLSTSGANMPHQGLSAAFNPQTQTKIGVTLNGGAAAAFTVHLVSAELVNLA